MQIVGHASPQMWKRYNHIQDGDLTNAANKFGKYLETTTPVTFDETAERRQNGNSAEILGCWRSSMAEQRFCKPFQYFHTNPYQHS
jgi:hypothetical protein